MAVSRFLKFAILNNFSENVLAPTKPLGRAPDPSGPGGLMRKRVACKGSKARACRSAFRPPMT